MMILLITPTLGLLALIFVLLWLWAIADVLSAKFKKKRQRWWWLAAIMLIPLLGMWAYYLWSGPHKVRKSKYAAFLPDAYPDQSSKHLQIIYRDGGMGLKNNLGQLILAAKYPEIKLLGEKLASFSPQAKGKARRKFGLVHHSGKVLLPTEFDEIRQIEDAVFIRLGKEVQQFDLEGAFIQAVSAMPK